MLERIHAQRKLSFTLFTVRGAVAATSRHTFDYGASLYARLGTLLRLVSCALYGPYLPLLEPIS